MGDLEQLNGVIQRIYGDDTRYVLLSKVQFGTMWTVEIGSVGDSKPRWWRSVLDAEDIPKPLTPDSALAAIIEGELFLSGMKGADASPKLKFYPSRSDAASLHLMSYSAEESAQRAEKVLFEFAGTAQKSGCRLFSSAPATSSLPITQPTSYSVPTPVTPVKSSTILQKPGVMQPSSAPTSPDKSEAEAEIARLKEELVKSENAIRNLKDTVSFQGGLAKAGEMKRNQPAAPKLPKDRSKGNAVQRKRVVERVEFESDSDDDKKPGPSSKKPGPSHSRTPQPSSSVAARSAKPPPRKKRVVTKNDFQSDDD